MGKKLISYLMGRTRGGDIRPTLMLDHPDVQLTFPGQSSWAGVFAGKAEVERWLRRFAATGIQIFPDEVIVTGWPWRNTVCIRGRDFLRENGETVYQNRYVIWGRMAWGRLREYEVYEDTHAANQFDTWLTEHRPALAVAA
ncbi:MAG: nuclear transport factor 2 family protein [Solirubrobacteraceae bacterium]